jgi:hypothetical protein
MNQEGDLLEQEGERCFRDAIEEIWIQAGEEPGFKFGQNVLSRKDGNWLAADRIVGILRRRSAQIGGGGDTDKQLADAIWALVEGKLSFKVLESSTDDNGFIKLLLPFGFLAPTEPVSLTPLNNAQLNKPERIFWVKVGLAILVINKLLAKVIITHNILFTHVRKYFIRPCLIR